MRTPSPVHIPRKCQHAIDRSPNYNFLQAASTCEKFRGVSRPSSAAAAVDKTTHLFSSFTPSHVFPAVGGRPVIPIVGPMAREVERQRRAQKSERESPIRERQHQRLANELHSLRCTPTAELVTAPPLSRGRSKSPMLEVSSTATTKEEAFELRGTSLVSIGGLVQPFIRPASAGAGSLKLVVSGGAAHATPTENDAAVAAASEQFTSTACPDGRSTKGALKIFLSQPRPSSSSQRLATASDDVYQINVLLRTRPASGNTRGVPAEHYPLRSVVL